MTSKVIEGHKSSSNFSVIQPFTYWMVCWCFALKLVWISLSLSFSLTLHLVLSSPLFLSLYIPLYVPLLLSALIYVHTEKCFFIFIRHHFFIKWSMILRVTWARPLLCCVIYIFFLSFDQITTLSYILKDSFCPCFS